MGQGEMSQTAVVWMLEGTVTGRKRYREMGSRVGRRGPLPTAATLFSREVGSGEVKLQYFGHLMRRLDSLEKTLILGGIGGRRRRVRIISVF